MKIKWLGHATFLITSDAGVKVLTDPYALMPNMGYGEIKESADVVTVSHEHPDHNNVAAVKGNPKVIKGTALQEVKGIKFIGLATFHDEDKGTKRGPNTIYCFEVDGVKVCHLGDLGHQLSDKDAASLGKIDVLLIPVGGFYTIDAKVASEVVAKLSPKVVIPMHYKTDKMPNHPTSTVDGFLQGKANVGKKNTSEVEFQSGSLPSATQVIVLKPAL